MNRSELALVLEDFGFDCDEIVLFDNPSYDEALIGVTTSGRAVYDYDEMINCLVNGDKMTYDEAIEWLEFNTVRAAQYNGDNPIMMYRLDTI